MSKHLKLSVFDIIKQVLIVTISIVILGISINMFMAPHNIAAGGVSGIGVLAEVAFGIDRAIIVLILNIVMLALAYIFLGKATFANILLGSLLLPLALAVIPENKIIDDRMISILAGSAFFGIGVAILYRNNASSGGTTIPPLIFRKFYNINTSIGLLVTDMTIVIFNIFVFGIESFFWAILSLIVTSIVMSYIETGLDRKRVMLINSISHLTDIAEAALAEGHSKVRYYHTFDKYHDLDDLTLMLLLDNLEYPNMLKIVQSIDPSAIIITYNVAELHGLDPESNVARKSTKEARIQ